jgi:DNA-binding NarL/FixJ family response regulator
VALAKRLKPDVVVTDLTMPEMDGTAVTKEIVADVPETRVVVLTVHAEAEYVTPVLEAGAAGYLLKSDAHRELIDAIRGVVHGQQFVRAGARSLSSKPPLPPTDRDRYQLLTAREQAVLALVGRGYSAPEIGERLAISPKTVDTYKQRIQEKLGFTHRSQYVQFALKLGLLSAS